MSKLNSMEILVITEIYNLECMSKMRFDGCDGKEIISSHQNVINIFETIERFVKTYTHASS